MIQRQIGRRSIAFEAPARLRFVLVGDVSAQEADEKSSRNHASVAYETSGQRVDGLALLSAWPVRGARQARVEGGYFLCAGEARDSHALGGVDLTCFVVVGRVLELGLGGLLDRVDAGLGAGHCFVEFRIAALTHLGLLAAVAQGLRAPLDCLDIARLDGLRASAQHPDREGSNEQSFHAFSGA